MPGHETGQLVTQVFFKPLIHFGDESCFISAASGFCPPPQIVLFGKGKLRSSCFSRWEAE